MDQRTSVFGSSLTNRYDYSTASLLVFVRTIGLGSLEQKYRGVTSWGCVVAVTPGTGQPESGSTVGRSISSAETTCVVKRMLVSSGPRTFGAKVHFDGQWHPKNHQKHLRDGNSSSLRVDYCH